jgi:hypothetical protein
VPSLSGRENQNGAGKLQRFVVASPDGAGASNAGVAPMAGAMAPGRPPFKHGGHVSLIGDDAQNDISSYKPAHFTKKNQGGGLAQRRACRGGPRRASAPASSKETLSPMTATRGAG